MSAKFCVDAWAAWAPGLPSQEAWLSWFSQESPALLPEPEGQVLTPALSEMPAMMRRRIDPLGRVALQTAYWAQGEAKVSGPVVFASRWGELSRSIDLLESLVAEQGMSPTSFSLSVHNAIGALYSIARGDTANYLAVAGGEFSAEAAFVEAQALLADGAEAVLLVVFEAPLPELVAAQDPSAPPVLPAHAWACQLSRAKQGGLSLSSCAQEQGQAGVPIVATNSSLAVLKFLLGQQRELMRSTGRSTWCWTRHEA